jgi:hypothetical protein
MEYKNEDLGKLQFLHSKTLIPHSFYISPNCGLISISSTTDCPDRL